MNALRWILALVLAALFLFMASFKFMPEITGEANPIFPLIASNTGISLVEPYLRWITGVMELVAGLLLIMPRTRLAGAGLALCIMIGALVTHLTPILGMEVPGQGHFIFYMAILMFVLTLLVLFLSRPEKTFRVAN